jgi:peroxiredoxin
LQKKYRAQGLKVVSVSIDDGSSTPVKKFVATMKPAFKVVHDPDQKAAAAFGVGGIPANYVIGRDGKLAAKVGFDLPALQKAVAKSVAGSSTRASR